MNSFHFPFLWFEVILLSEKTRQRLQLQVNKFWPFGGGGLVRSKHQSTRDDAGKNEIDSNEELEHQQKVFNHYA